MGYILFICIAAGAAALAAASRTRYAKLARLARLNGCAFVKEKETVTTPLSAGRLEFFTLFFHHFQNVFTYSDHMAYIRVADDNLYMDDKPKTKPQCITIFTAELREGQFPALKAAPLDSQLAPSQHTLMKTNIPAVDSRYRIHAPTPQDDAEKRAQAMLKALCTPQTPAKEGSGRHGALWIFIMLAVLAGMTFLSWLMLNRMTH